MDSASKLSAAALIWESLLGSAVGKHVDVSLYAHLCDTIPDKFIEIQEFAPFSEADDIESRFRPYLENREIYPVLFTLGGNAICIGTSGESRGVMYYFDFDFGLFELNRINIFMSKLTRLS